MYIYIHIYIFTYIYTYIYIRRTWHKSSSRRWNSSSQMSARTLQALRAPAAGKNSQKGLPQLIYPANLVASWLSRNISPVANFIKCLSSPSCACSREIFSQVQKTMYSTEFSLDLWENFKEIYLVFHFGLLCKISERKNYFGLVRNFCWEIFSQVQNVVVRCLCTMTLVPNFSEVSPAPRRRWQLWHHLQRFKKRYSQKSICNFSHHPLMCPSPSWEYANFIKHIVWKKFC